MTIETVSEWIKHFVSISDEENVNRLKFQCQTSFACRIQIKSKFFESADSHILMNY
jgi:hypothetical protein